jgi:hypothetical protein
MSRVWFGLPGTREPRRAPLGRELRGWLEELKAAIRPDRIETKVREMPAPRNWLHAPEAMAQAEYQILGAFSTAGWHAERRPFVFENAQAYQDHGESLADYMRVVVHPRLEGANLLAVKEGVSPEAVLVLAHFDTVRDSPGANDNTASVSALLELALVLASYRFRRTILLAATDMEELNLFGARALAQQLAQERPLVGVINYETMGYTANEPGSQSLPPGIDLLFPGQFQRMRANEFRGDFTTVIYNGRAAGMAASFASALSHLAGAHVPMLLRNPADLPVTGRLLGRAVPMVQNFARGDHLPFWQLGVPGLFVNDTANFRYRYYHTWEDTPEKLDYERLGAIVGATAGVLAELCGLEDS